MKNMYVIQPLISVIVPVYKVEEYLPRCIESIINQTYENLEIILINDGSPDNCGKTCNKYADKDDRITVVNQENQGLSGARNTGLKIAKGEYITFVDSDDYIVPEFVEKLYSMIVQSKANIAICDYFIFSEENQIKKDKEGCLNYSIITGREACTRIYGDSSVKYVTAWAKLFRKNFFEDIQFPEGKLNEDEFITYKLFYPEKVIADSSERLYGYFYNSQGIMRDKFNLRRYDILQALHERIEYFQAVNDTELVNMTKEKNITMIAMLSVMARKSKVYRFVIKPYKISLFKAIRRLEADLGRDKYEAFLIKYYPSIVRIQAYWKKLTAS